MRLAPVAVVLACLAPMLGPERALAAPPPGALNKTITTSFAVTIPAKGADGSIMTQPLAVRKTIYISSAGRVFSRSSRHAGRTFSATENGPDVTSGAFRFANGSLIGVQQVGSGASQLVINFSSDFRSCTAEVVTAGQGGRPIIWTGMNGVRYTSTGPASVSSLSCSIQSGNAFAGE